jgi:hypothetical protein
MGSEIYAQNAGGRILAQGMDGYEALPKLKGGDQQGARVASDSRHSAIAGVYGAHLAQFKANGREGCSGAGREERETGKGGTCGAEDADVEHDATQLQDL